MDGLKWKTLFKLMIWGAHPYFWKHPVSFPTMDFGPQQQVRHQKTYQPDNLLELGSDHSRNTACVKQLEHRQLQLQLITSMSLPLLIPNSSEVHHISI